MNTADILMDFGHSMVEAQSAALALQLLQSGDRFDAVITDYAMPGMNGLDLATGYERSSPSCRSFLRSDMFPQRATIDFPRVGKPYTQHELAAALESALSTERYEYGSSAL
jgi:CheY-like chemotaxis protein